MPAKQDANRHPGRLPNAERKACAETIMERFVNPPIRHELISIALNSVSKWQVRVLPTIKDYAAKHGGAPAGLAFSLAALRFFDQGKLADNGNYVGKRQGQIYLIKDNADILAIMNAAWDGATDMTKVASTLLADKRLWGEDLTLVPGLAQQTASALTQIKAIGVKAAMREL